MAIACHPYLSGVPHRIGMCSARSNILLGQPGVVAWDGAKIFDWYLAQDERQYMSTALHFRSAFVPHDLKNPRRGGEGPLAGLTAAVKDMYDIAG